MAAFRGTKRPDKRDEKKKNNKGQTNKGNENRTSGTVLEGGERRANKRRRAIGELARGVSLSLRVELKDVSVSVCML